MKERFAWKVSELGYYLGKYQLIVVLGKPGTVEIEASDLPASIRAGHRCDGSGSVSPQQCRNDGLS